MSYVSTSDSRAGRSVLRFRKVTASAVAVAALIAVAPRPAAADLTGFGQFAPINQALENPAATVSNGYYGGTTFQLTTDQANGQAVTGFGAAKQDITSFVAQYTYLGTYSGNPADGVAFVVQNDPRGTTALGDRGGAMGVGGTTAPITKSAETYLSIYYSGQSASSFGTNGGNTGYYYTGAANARNQYPVDVRITYSGTNWITTIRDGMSGQIYTRSDTVTGGLPALLGSSTGYVGFGGGTGGFTSTQTVSNFKFNSTAGLFTPIKVSGFNQDVIVETGATDFQAAVTATLDNGTLRDGSNNLSGGTLYEKGWNTAAPTTGVPSAGQVVTSSNDARHSFSLASAVGNNALYLAPLTPSGTLTFDRPDKFSALSILTTTGSGSGGFDVVVHFADGSPDETITSIISPDWFYNAGAGINAHGRVFEDLTTDSTDSDNPRLYQEDLGLTNKTSPVASLTFNYIGGSGNTFILGVSGVPEPTTAGLLGAGALAALARRRRRAS